MMPNDNNPLAELTPTALLEKYEFDSSAWVGFTASARAQADRDMAEIRRRLERLAKLESALEQYADPNNWQCNRCKGRDHLNCFMGRWAGPCGNHVAGCGDGDSPCLCDRHGYTIAHGALDGQ